MQSPFLNVVEFLRASFRRLPEKILGDIVQRSKMLANSWGSAWAIALGNAWRNRATSLGGSWAYWWCSSAAFFGKWCISPRGSWLIPVRFLGQCPGTSCNQLVGCWRPFAGKLGRLPWETPGKSCKGLWGVLPNSARILERLLRGVAQSSWGILACSWEFKKVLAKSLWLQAWAAPIITQSSVVSNGDHLKNCPSDFR